MSDSKKKKAIECAHYKCKHRMWESDLVDGKTDGFATDQVCPKCGEHTYYYLTDLQTKNWLKKQSTQVKAKQKFDCRCDGVVARNGICGDVIISDNSCGAAPGTQCEHRVAMREVTA